MYKFSKRSLNNLKEADEQLQRLFKEVIKEIDCVVICGHRGKASQNKAYYSGHSKLKFPQSKHNKMPSMAVDVCPYPINWNDITSFKILGRVVKRKAKELGISISWGGDWRSFKDYPHYQLK